MKSITFVALCLAVVLPSFARAADTEYKQILITPHDGVVEVRLPLTDVTGPVRVKQRMPDGFGIPIAPSRTNLDGSCYLEWQISYDTLSTEHPSIVRGVKFQRDSRTKYGCELTKILLGAIEQHVLSRSQVKGLREELARLRSVDLETTEKIALQPKTKEAEKVPPQFERFVQSVPQFVASTRDGSVEIQFKPRQYAVGYQPMVFVCLPSKAWGQPGGGARAEGKAHVKETVTYRFGPPQHELLLSIVRAFGMVSHAHNEDLTKIVDAVLDLTANTGT